MSALFKSWPIDDTKVSGRQPQWTNGPNARQRASSDGEASADDVERRWPSIVGVRIDAGRVTNG
jgi:hypothetical protein